MVHVSLWVLGGKVLQSQDGCPPTTCGHDGGVGLVWGALGTDPSPLAQDDNLAPMTTVGHDGGEENGEENEAKKYA